MKNVLVSIFIGLCIFLGNISGQAKSFKIVEHVSSAHSHDQNHDHAHTHQHHHKKSKKKSSSHDHQHHAELSFLTVHLALPTYEGVVFDFLVSYSTISGYYSTYVLHKLSFSPPVFRPPIS